MRLSCVILLALLTCAGCSQPLASAPTTSSSSPSHSREARTRELRQKLKAVIVADGISKSEAELIVECYFHQNVGCGGFTGIRDGGDFWIVDGAFGYSGTPIQGFHISKSAGKIKSPIGPSYATPFEILPQS